MTTENKEYAKLVAKINSLNKIYQYSDALWFAALADAGIKYSSVFGHKYEYNGNVFKSKAEFTIGKWLHEHNFEYVYEPPYADGTKRKFDFYVSSVDLYIEYYGMINQTDYRKAVGEKQQSYKDRHVLELFADDDLEDKLSSVIMYSYHIGVKDKILEMPLGHIAWRIQQEMLLEKIEPRMLN